METVTGYGAIVEHDDDLKALVDKVDGAYTDEYRQVYDDGVESFRPKFEEMKARFDQKIAELSRENEILKNPQCEQCDNFEFGMCQHYRSRDCYLYHRGGTVSLFKIKESK